MPYCQLATFDNRLHKTLETNQFRSDEQQTLLLIAIKNECNETQTS